MGVLQNHGEVYGHPDTACEHVLAALTERIRQRWEPVWSKPGHPKRLPAPMMRDGSPGVERVSFGGRQGYSFAFQCGVLLQWFSQARLRFREQELLEAIREVVLELDLEPTILWSRYQEQLPMLPMGRPTVLVVNLFDRA
jgi:hypothetical protein